MSAECLHRSASTFSGGDVRTAGRVMWCSKCGACRWEAHAEEADVWTWTQWYMPDAPALREPDPTDAEDVASNTRDSSGHKIRTAEGLYWNSHKSVWEATGTRWLGYSRKNMWKIAREVNGVLVRRTLVGPVRKVEKGAMAGLLAKATDAAIDAFNAAPHGLKVPEIWMSVVKAVFAAVPPAALGAHASCRLKVDLLTLQRDDALERAQDHASLCNTVQAVHHALKSEPGDDLVRAATKLRAECDAAQAEVKRLAEHQTAATLSAHVLQKAAKAASDVFSGPGSPWARVVAAVIGVLPVDEAGLGYMHWLKLCDDARHERDVALARVKQLEGHCAMAADVGQSVRRTLAAAGM